MATPPFTTDIVNHVFRRVATSEPIITLEGKREDVLEIAALITGGYRPDAEQPTVFHVLARHLACFYTSPGADLPTAGVLKAFFDSEEIEHDAERVLPPHLLERFQAARTGPLVNPSEYLHLLPYMLDLFYDGNSRITMIGVICRSSEFGKPFTYKVSKHTNARRRGGSTLWIAVDEELFGGVLTRLPWWAVIDLETLPAQIPDTRSQKATICMRRDSPEDFAVALARLAPAAPLPDVPDTVFAPFEVDTPAPTAGPSTPAPRGGGRTKKTEDKPTAEDEAIQKVIGTDVNHFGGAPPLCTDLPWDLMKDITLNELFIYFPNHATQWPGLALIHAHYRHRMADHWYDPARMVERLFDARGCRNKQVKTGWAQKFRNWMCRAVAELTGTYDVEEGVHMAALYKLLGAVATKSPQINNVSKLLEHVMKTVPKRCNGLKPPMSLADIGKHVKEHPVGWFAQRVQAAMRNVTLPPHDVNLDYHWLINPLNDLTTSRRQSQDEEVAKAIHEYNQAVQAGSTPLFLIKPPTLYGEAHYRRETNPATGQINPESQSWGWLDESYGQTVIDNLEERFNREDFIRHHWPDLQKEVYLWLRLKLKPTQIIDELPFAARRSLMNNNLPEDVGDKQIKDSINMAFRKRKEMAIIARLAGNKDTATAQAWKNGGTRDNSKPYKGSIKNKQMYEAEVQRFDKYEREYQNRPTGPGKKRAAETEAEPETSNKRPRITAQEVQQAAQRPPSPPVVYRPSAVDNFHNGNFVFQQVGGQIYAAPTRLLPDRDNPVPVPQWWRASRMNLLRQFLPDREHNQADWDASFDAGFDVLPARHPEQGGAPIERIAADFTDIPVNLPSQGGGAQPTTTGNAPPPPPPGAQPYPGSSQQQRPPPPGAHQYPDPTQHQGSGQGPYFGNYDPMDDPGMQVEGGSFLDTMEFLDSQNYFEQHPEALGGRRRSDQSDSVERVLREPMDEQE